LPARLTPHDLVYAMTSVGDPQISPDGGTVAYVQSKPSPERARPQSQLWLLNRSSGERSNVSGSGANHTGPRWSPDGVGLACVRAGDDESGVAIRSGDSWVFHRTAAKPGELAWNAAGTQIAFVSTFDPANPDGGARAGNGTPPVRVVRRIDYKQENRGFLNDVRNAIFILDVAGGSIRRLTDDRIDHLAPQWSPDGRTLATKITTTNGMTSQLCLTTVADGSQKRIGPESGFISTWAFTPDGQAILYSGDTAQTWQADWFLHDLGSDETRRLTEDHPIAIDGGFPTVSLPAQPFWLDASHVLYHGFGRGQSGLYALDITTGDQREVATWAAVNSGFGVAGDGKTVAQVQAAPDHAGALIATNVSTGQSQVLFDPNEGTALAGPTTSWERITINRNGFDLDAWLLLPNGYDSNKTYPLVLNIHGGPNGHHGPSFDAVQQAMVGAGFAVLATNPRGSSSYGRAFTMAVLGDWAGEDYLDQEALLDEVCKRSYIDAGRLGVYGYSYGGFMTSWIIGHSTRFKAAVIGAPVVDHVSFYGTADFGHNFAPMQIGGTPWENPDEYRKRSPLTNLHTATTPSLILHGEADDRVPVSQGEQAFMTLHEAGCEVEFVRYPEEAHAMLRTGYPAHREDFMTRINDWFGRYLRD